MLRTSQSWYGNLKFEPIRMVRIILFDSVTWGWFPLWAALWAALCSTLPPKLPPGNGSERFLTIGGGTHGVWARLDQFLGFFVCLIVFLKWFSRLQSTWEGPEEEGLYNAKKKWNRSWGLSLSKAFVQQQWPPSLFQCGGVGQTWHWSCQAPRTLSNAPLIYIAVDCMIKPPNHMFVN